MSLIKNRKKIFWILIVTFLFSLHNVVGQNNLEWYLPINVPNRQSLENVQLTSIGRYGLMRKSRSGIPAHLHTGIDLNRPNPNYHFEPVFPAAMGQVISLRTDGPYAQVIIQHSLTDHTSLWTVYEHVAGIRVKLHELVHPHRPIARFMNKDELDLHGWQFDHVHFEIMKAKPPTRKPDEKKPFCYFGTYCLVCYTWNDLENRYYNPMVFFNLNWKEDV